MPMNPPVLARALETEPSPDAADSSIAPESSFGKFTLKIDCEVLLRPIPNPANTTTQPHHPHEPQSSNNPASSAPSTHAHINPTTVDGVVHTQTSHSQLSPTSQHSQSPPPSHVYVPRPALDAAATLHLDALVSLPIIQEIKLKCNHTCGALALEDPNKDTCSLTTLWQVGAWMVTEFQRVGREARIETWMNGNGARDLHEPDAVVTVFIG